MRIDMMPLKKLWVVLFMVTLIQSIPLYAQLSGGDFSNFTTVGTGDCSVNPDAFNTSARAPFGVPGCDGNQYWQPSHGTPEIVSFWGNRIALMWTGDFTDQDGVQSLGGEGLYYDCKFLKGKTYQLSFDLWNDNHSFNALPKVFMYLANGLTPNPVISYNPLDPSYLTPNISDKQLVFYETNLFQPLDIGNPPEHHTIYFIPTKDYDALWIYPESYATLPAQYLYIDNVLLEDCIDHQIYTNTSSLPWITARGNYITASTNTFVTNAQYAEFRAGNYILLDPLFEAQNGSVFYAFISGCGNVDCRDEGGGGRMAENKNIQSETVSIYPNPSSGRITLEKNSDENVTVEVLDLYGRTVFEKEQMTGNKIELDLSGQPAGIYLVRIFTGNEIKIIRLVKE
jgi:hypothetical protein